jgi:hypothetical protein
MCTQVVMMNSSMWVTMMMSYLPFSYRMPDFLHTSSSDRSFYRWWMADDCDDMFMVVITNRLTDTCQQRQRTVSWCDILFVGVWQLSKPDESTIRSVVVDANSVDVVVAFAVAVEEMMTMIVVMIVLMVCGTARHDVLRLTSSLLCS